MPFRLLSATFRPRSSQGCCLSIRLLCKKKKKMPLLDICSPAGAETVLGLPSVPSRENKVPLVEKMQPCRRAQRLAHKAWAKPIS